MYFNDGASNGDSKPIVDSNENQSDKEDKDIVKDLSLDSGIVMYLTNILYNEWGRNSFGTTGVSDYDNYFYKQNKTFISNIPDEMKMMMTFYSLGNPDSVNYSVFEKEYKKIFGNNVNVPNIKELQECSAAYKYIDGNYVVQETSCGGAFCGGSYQKLAYAKQITSSNENKIEIYEYFSMTDEITCENIYSDYSMTNLIDIPEGDSLDKHLDKLGMYKYTFIEDAAGNYIFNSVEKVK